MNPRLIRQLARPAPAYGARVAIRLGDIVPMPESVKELARKRPHIGAPTHG